jgi:pimeloyl-ACP methyl ester carboxylesterase
MTDLIAALCLFAASASCFAQAKLPKAAVIDDVVYTRPARLVDIGGGQRLNLYCLGSGSPTVILDAGMGDSTISWAMVQPAMAKTTRVCSFDRAGLGFSDAARRTSTPVNQAEDLHALLRAAGIKPPYVMVGHSLAGMNVRVYADKYRDDVVGMVIVDGSHEDQSAEGWALSAPGDKEKYDRYLEDQHACIDAARQGLAPGTKMFEKCLGDTKDPRFSAAINQAQAIYGATEKWQAAVASERENVFYASADETRKTRSDFGDMPIIVLTHSPFPTRTGESRNERNRKTLSWEGLHLRVAAMSTRGVNEIVPDAGHYIQYDKPQVVIDAVNQAVWISRGR